MHSKKGPWHGPFRLTFKALQGLTPFSLPLLSRAQKGKKKYLFKNISLKITVHKVATGKLLPRRTGGGRVASPAAGRRPHLPAQVTQSGVTGRQSRSPRSGSTARPGLRRLISNGQFPQSVAPPPPSTPPDFFLPRSLSTSCCVLAQ